MSTPSLSEAIPPAVPLSVPVMRVRDIFFLHARECSFLSHLCPALFLSSPASPACC